MKNINVSPELQNALSEPIVADPQAFIETEGEALGFFGLIVCCNDRGDKDG